MLILDVWQDSEYTSVMQYLTSITNISYLFHNNVVTERIWLKKDVNV